MIKICCLSNDQSKTMLKFFKSPGADLLRISNELQLEFIIEKVCWQMSNYENWSNCNCNWFQLENLAIDGIDHDWWTGATDAGHEGTWTWDDREDHDNLHHQDHHDNLHHQDHHDNATKESYWSMLMLVGWTMRRWWRTFCGRQTNQAAAHFRFSFCEISPDISKFHPSFVEISSNICKFQELLDVGRQLAIHGTRLLLLAKVQIIKRVRRVEMCWTLLLTLFTQLWHRGGLSHLPEDVEV